MIVIPRREGESIVIGNALIVTVIEVLDDAVRVSIERLPDGPDGEVDVADVVLPDEQFKKRPR